jgi:hypothetical protein
VVSYGMYSPRYVPVAVVQSLFDADSEIVDLKHLSWHSSMILSTCVNPLCCSYYGLEMYDVNVVCRVGDKLKVKHHFTFRTGGHHVKEPWIPSENGIGHEAKRR